MKFIVSRDVLYRNLSAINGVMAANTTLPILENYLLTIEGDRLKLTASDMDSTMTAEIVLDNVEGEGCVAVPARILLETLKLIPETPIVFVIDTEEHVFKFTAANGEYDAPCYDGAEYPGIEEMENPDSFDIDAAILQRAVGKTLFATGNEALRPTMTGIYCELNGEYIAFVSTDAHKLVRYRNRKLRSDVTASFIMPKKPMAHLRNILSEAEGDVHVEYSAESHHIRFSFGDWVLYSSLIEGKFPNYQAVIPDNNVNTFVVSRDELLKSIRRVCIYSNQSTHLIRISLSDSAAHITAEDMDYSNRAAEVVNGEYTGEPMDIGFNSRYIREMLENMDSDQVCLKLSSPGRAALLSPIREFDENESLLMLLMPVMLNY